MSMQDVEKTDVKQDTNAKRMRRRRRLMPFYILIVLILTACLGISLSMTIFFNIDTVIVKGEAQQYTVDEIIEAAKIHSKQNLTRLNVQKIEKNVYDELIYIETVKVSKQYPDTLVIDVQKCRESYNISYDNGILMTSESGKIITNSAEAAEALPVFYGYQPSVLDPGKQLASQDKQKEKIFNTFSEIMKRELSCPITSVDMTDKYDIRVNFDNRIIFDMGNWNEIEYKITLAESVIVRLGTDKIGYLTMVGNNQCAFRDKESDIKDNDDLLKIDSKLSSDNDVDVSDIDEDNDVDGVATTIPEGSDNDESRGSSTTIYNENPESSESSTSNTEPLEDDITPMNNNGNNLFE